MVSLLLGTFLLHTGQEVALQPGCREVLRRAAESGVSTHVVSVNWSSELLRGALPPPLHQAAGGPQSRAPAGTGAAGGGGAAAAADPAAAAAGSAEVQTGSGTSSSSAAVGGGGSGGGASPGDALGQRLGAEAELLEDDKEAAVPETAAAYQAKAAGVFGDGGGEALNGSPADIGDGLQVGLEACFVTPTPCRRIETTIKPLCPMLVLLTRSVCQL